MIEASFETNPLSIAAPVLDGTYIISSEQCGETFHYPAANLLVETTLITHDEMSTLLNGGVLQTVPNSPDASFRIYGTDRSWTTIDPVVIQALMKKLDSALAMFHLSTHESM